MHACFSSRLPLLTSSSTHCLRSTCLSKGIFGDIVPDFVQHGEPGLLQRIQGIHEEWAAAAGPLQPVTAYGMRVYRRGASLAFHTDRVDTHVISSIFHIDHLYDDEAQPWPIEIEGHDGKRHAVSLAPGQMLLYESAKVTPWCERG